MSQANKLIVLDRDGVINQDSDNYIKTVDEWIPLEGSMEAMAMLTKAGYQIAIATNQSGIARGYFTLETLNDMHRKMNKLATDAGAKINYIAYCPHVSENNCDCRKPLPGLIHQIETALNISAKDCYMVGDSLRDLQAGSAAGLKPILVLTGKGQRTLDKGEGLNKVPVFENLKAFVAEILSN